MVERKPSKGIKRHERQLRHQQEAAEISRRGFVKQLSVAGGYIVGLGIAGAAWYIGSKTPDQEPQKVEDLSFEQTKEQLQKDEKTLQQTIEQADRAMSNLEGLINLKAQTLSESHKQQLLEPFELYNVNKQNPHRNVYTFLLESLNQRGADALNSPIDSSIADRRFFFMRLLDARATAVAIGVFKPLERTLFLVANIQGTNLFDGLVIYHETEHARQDSFIRQFLDNPEIRGKYNAFGFGGGTKPRIIIDQEYQAWAKQIEVLDSLSEGRLKTNPLRGLVETDYYMGMLGARPAQRNAVGLLISTAAVYYQSGSSIDAYIGNYPQFLNRVVYKEYDLYRLINPETFDVKPN